MSEAAIRGAIGTLLDAVTGVGVVHEYRRTSRSLATYLELMRSSGVVNAWTIFREKCLSERDTVGTVLRRHYFRIQGIYAVDDSAGSEKTFQALLDTIYQAFDANQRLSGNCLYCDPFQVEEVGYEPIPATDGGTLFHTADCLLICHEHDASTAS